MREVIIQTNNSFKTDVSNDLGAFTGLLFDIGVKKIIIDSEQIFSEKERKKIAKIIN